LNPGRALFVEPDANAPFPPGKADEFAAGAALANKAGLAAACLKANPDPAQKPPPAITSTARMTKSVRTNLFMYLLIQMGCRFSTCDSKTISDENEDVVKEM
jgi:hypothetical protein